MQRVHVVGSTQQIKIEKLDIIFYYSFSRDIFAFADIFNISEKLFYAYLFWGFKLGH